MDSYIHEIQKYLVYVNQLQFEYSINISLKNKYIYVETPKVGCSTIKASLQRMELGRPEIKWDDFEDIHLRKYSPLLTPSQVHGLDRYLDSDEYFVFCFVRNPYVRLLSAYLDKIDRGMLQKKDVLIAMGKDPQDFSVNISFEDFVSVVCDMDTLKMNPHWRLQYYQTFQDVINYDFVGKLESFHADFSAVMRQINSDFTNYYRPEVRHSTSAQAVFKKYYTEELRRKVYLRYKIDFEYFGYDEEASP